MKKKLIVAAAAGALTLAGTQAFAFENEFHGMYKFMGYESNAFNGLSLGLQDKSHSGWFAEQRARLQYIAKANDNLKLVTHFELDSRFGGKPTTTTATATNPGGDAGYLGTKTGNDAGNLDADQLTLETKNIYLDFNCPITGANVKAGIQPWADSYQSLFLLADMAGVYATKSFGPATASLGWFRFDDNTANSHNGPGQLTADLIVVDGKYAINKDIKVGASYYNIQNDSGTTTPGYQLLHMGGVNADLTFGPANIKPFAAFQTGDLNEDDKLKGYLLGAVTKTKVGPGAINVSAIYLSGDKDGTGDAKNFVNVTSNTSYFNAANMWLLIRSGQAINSSHSVLGNDITVGGRGLLGAFAGYEGAMDKLFYNANIGYAQAAEKRSGDDGKKLGMEFNAQVGYKLYDNLSVSVAGAYADLKDDLFGDVDNPYMINTQLSYTF